MTEIFASGQNKLSLEQSTYWVNTQGHTGRTVRGGEGLDFATEWSSLSTPEEMLDHPGVEELRHAISNVSRLVGRPVDLFRGRGFEDGKKPSPEDMGPPPTKRAPDGRYNKARESVLYLSDSTEGVLREREAWNAKGTPYVQQFRLPVDEITIADFTECPSVHFVTAVFLKAEECNVEGRGPENYFFSQVVANIVSSQFEGMKVCGTRGQPGATYSNVVVFKPQNRWTEWLESEPIPLDR